MSLLKTENPEWAERFATRRPHFFIAIVAFQDIQHEVYEDHMQWMAATASRLTGRAMLSFGMANRKEQYRARNYLVHHAQVQGADFILMIDDDTMLAKHPDLIEKFYKNGKELQGALYWQRGGNYHPVVMKQIPGTKKAPRFRFYHQDELPRELAPVDVIGGGCNFIDMKLFDRLKEPHWRLFHEDEYETIFTPNPDFGMDVDLCMRAKKLGYDAWLDPTIEVGHLQQFRWVMDEKARPPQELIAQTKHYRDYMTGVVGAEVTEREPESEECPCCEPYSEAADLERIAHD